MSLRLSLLANIHVRYIHVRQKETNVEWDHIPWTRSFSMEWLMAYQKVLRVCCDRSGQYRCVLSATAQGAVKESAGCFTEKTLSLKSLSTKLCFQPQRWDPSTRKVLPLQGQESGGVEQKWVQIFCIDSPMKWWLWATLLYFWQEVLNLLDSYQDLTREKKITWTFTLGLYNPTTKLFVIYHIFQPQFMFKMKTKVVLVIVVNLQESANAQKQMKRCLTQSAVQILACFSC